MARAMRDSGVAWIGEIPANWVIRRLKDAGSFQTGRDHKGLNEGGTPVYGSSREPFAFVDRTLCKRKAIAIGRKGTIDQPFIIPEGFWAVDTCMYHTVPKKSFTFEYVGYWVNIVPWKEISTQTALPSLTQTDANNATVCYPPLPEQRAIADYIDQQTALIDQRLCTLEEKKTVLAELRKATIHEAITKGAIWDGDTGEVENLPAGWVMVRIKDVAKLRSGDFISAEKIESNGEFPVYGGNGLRGYTDSFTHNGEFALVGRQGALCGNINYAKEKFWATEHAVVVRHKRKMVTRWLGEMLCCMNLNQYATASAQPGLSVEIVINKFLPLPPLDEQSAIANHLDQQTQHIDAQLATLDEQAQVLKELRKAIIHEAVTGKIDLSGVVSGKEKR